MWSILKGEWRKLRRCQILLVGIVALALCPVVQYGTQLIINPEMRDQNFDFVKLFANVIWGNTQIFLPISLVMIGGWLIDRENTNDTMKNGAMNYRYTLSTYDETGAERELSFETSRILTDDAYLCLKVAPFRGVVTWAEVQFDEMPAAVQEQYGGNS